MSRLIKIFTVCLVHLFFIPIFEIGNKQVRCPNLAVRPIIRDFTQCDCSNLLAHTQEM